MSDDTVAPFLFPPTSRKKVTATFDGGRITSDGGVMLLAAAVHRHLGLELSRISLPFARHKIRPFSANQA